MPAHIPIILNFSGKVNGKRARSIGKFNREVLLRTIASTRRFRRHKKFPGFRREKNTVSEACFHAPQTDRGLPPAIPAASPVLVADVSENVGAEISPAVAPSSVQNAVL